uniref:Secreted protein n=1 Tax=Anopheles darlingi TaxID=43151 RepID=A0A2M4D9B5_ANODA
MTECVRVSLWLSVCLSMAHVYRWCSIGTTPMASTVCKIGWLVGSVIHGLLKVHNKNKKGREKKRQRERERDKRVENNTRERGHSDTNVKR